MAVAQDCKYLQQNQHTQILAAAAAAAETVGEAMVEGSGVPTLREGDSSHRGRRTSRLFVLSALSLRLFQLSSNDKEESGSTVPSASPEAPQEVCTSPFFGSSKLALLF